MERRSDDNEVLGTWDDRESLYTVSVMAGLPSCATCNVCVETGSVSDMAFDLSA
jgi:hypothetical protein